MTQASHSFVYKKSEIVHKKSACRDPADDDIFLVPRDM